MDVNKLCRCRLNSCQLRDLTKGRFLVKSENLNQLELIGQGINNKKCPLFEFLSFSGEFGIVYRARLGPNGGSSHQQVAIKTLKGESDHD